MASNGTANGLFENAAGTALATSLCPAKLKHRGCGKIGTGTLAGEIIVGFFSDWPGASPIFYTVS